MHGARTWGSKAAAAVSSLRWLVHAVTHSHIVMPCVPRARTCMLNSCGVTCAPQERGTLFKVQSMAIPRLTSEMRKDDQRKYLEV